jgi:hypothetical protein
MSFSRSPSMCSARRRPPRRTKGALWALLLFFVAVQVGCDEYFEHRLFSYLDMQQDPHTGLLESYTPNADLPSDFLEYLQNRPGFVYDKSLVAIAYLDRATSGDWHRARRDLKRARRILDAFLIVQDPETGGLPDAVNVRTLEPVATDYGTGNQMWAVLALLKGYRVLGNPAYLDAAETVGSFVLEQKNTVGYGGFVLFPDNGVVSAEHNTDAYAAFSQLAEELDALGRSDAADEFWAAATHARIFVESRFDPITGKTFTGTDATGVTTATFPVPEDMQSWPVLSLGGSKWSRGFDWLLGPDGLWTTSASFPRVGPFEISGPSFSDADRSEVWVEGLGHVWVAAKLLEENNHPRLRHSPPGLMLGIFQKMAPHTDGLGLVATCGTLDTGFDFSYFNALAVAPTVWAIFGVRGLNPFWDLSTAGGVAAHPGSAVPWAALDVPPNAEFTCPTGDPCYFTVTGTSSGVAGESNLAIYVLIQPIDPSAGGTYAQFPPAAIASDGTWSSRSKLGSSQWPALTGDTMEVSAMIVDTGAGNLPPSPPAITPDAIPGLVAVTGILPATVLVAP